MAVLIFGSVAPGMETAAAAAEPRSVPPTGLSGFWALRFDSRNVPPALLLRSVTPQQSAQHESADSRIIRWCRIVGTPALMDGGGAPISIIEGKQQIAISAQMPSAARHIYLDRTQPPEASTYDATTNGFSIGHWDHDTLVVETSGFNDDGVTMLPGGGFRTPTSRLTEYYRLAEGGKWLEVTFVWTDPNVFAAPHAYAFRYYRVPRFDAGEFLCESNDPERAGFLSSPPAAEATVPPVTGNR
jgi:hypothetical protein